MSDTKVYHGSCHCGNVKYQVRLTLPPLITTDPTAKTVSIYKCNCTTCQKMGFFHCRPINPEDDFILTSPDPSELGDYRVYDKKHGWYFCKNCGVRTFGLGGAWEETELDVDEWAGREKSKDGTEKVWKTKSADCMVTVDGKQTTRNLHYLSVNAVTLENVDLREWHEKEWMFYVDCLRTPEQGPRFGKPYAGGMY
ncbi:hypothetical protein BDV96DRAFT_254608 [Lophiotrema nucula]|uniref:CENP-V/GFA domain-containing protein n=1 Tax=Lophiotrema nucula TaxID=690887 RepID=A0A6A5YP47_9PLEO|nr:hypothetical protein BDV96DRAFT_254608 [Lophiotrema nucula]